MSDRYSAFYANPRLLSDRGFEKNSPMLYPMDTVKVSRRFVGAKDPLAGRVGYVMSIGHILPSRTNREQLLVEVAGKRPPRFNTLFYTLELIKKDKSIAPAIVNQFGCLIYIDDRVEAVRGPPTGRKGNITSLSGVGNDGGWLGLTVTDEDINDAIIAQYKTLVERADHVFKRRNTDRQFRAYLDAARRKNQQVCDSIPKQRIRAIFESSLRTEIVTQLSLEPDFAAKIKQLEARRTFFVPSQDVKLIERFPPNTLFKNQVY